MTRTPPGRKAVALQPVLPMKPQQAGGTGAAPTVTLQERLYGAPATSRRDIPCTDSDNRRNGIFRVKRLQICLIEGKSLHGGLFYGSLLEVSKS